MVCCMCIPEANIEFMGRFALFCDGVYAAVPLTPFMSWRRDCSSRIACKHSFRLSVIRSPRSSTFPTAGHKVLAHKQKKLRRTSTTPSTSPRPCRRGRHPLASPPVADRKRHAPTKVGTRSRTAPQPPVLSRRMLLSLGEGYRRHRPIPERWEHDTGDVIPDNELGVC